MAASLFHLISTVLMAAAGSVSTVAVKQAVADAGQASGEAQFVRCAEARDVFSHAPHPAQPARPVWVLSRNAAEAPAYCGGDGEQPFGPGPADPDWLERRPGVVGLPRLLV